MNDSAGRDRQRTNDWVDQAIRSPKRNIFIDVAQAAALVPPFTVLNPSVYRGIYHALRTGERGARGLHRGNMRFSESGDQLDLFKNILKADNNLSGDPKVQKIVEGWAKKEAGTYKIWIDCHEDIETTVDLPKKRTRFGRERDADKDIKVRFGKGDPQAIKAALLMVDELTRQPVQPNRLVMSNWLAVGRSRELARALSEVSILSNEESGTHTISSEAPPPSYQEPERLNNPPSYQEPARLNDPPSYQEPERLNDQSILEAANGSTRPYAGIRSSSRAGERPRSR